MPNEISIPANLPIAYFCAEYGFDPDLPLYAGGLGVLAGDTIKQAADDNVPMIAIGLLYRGYSMRQSISSSGEQLDTDWQFDPVSAGLEHVYKDEQPLFIKVHLTEVQVWLRIWKKSLGDSVTLYLLDTDTDQNRLPERVISQVLYCGTYETQLKQQLILGIGGVKLLKSLGITPAAYHFNEGRPAFAHWQIIRQLMDAHKIDYQSARKLAVSKSVYTNHTLVAAGNQHVAIDLLRLYGRYYAEKMGISIEELLLPGIEDNAFSITRFALNATHVANGVSQPHTTKSQTQWPEYHWVDITNGIHLPTWQSPEIASAQEDAQLWQAHLNEKQRLAEFCHRHTGYQIDPKRLIITWARRLAGYKQLPILFQDLNRLKALLSQVDRPVQLLVSGKAHQGDTAGKAMLKQILGMFGNELNGLALYLPDYSLRVASFLVRGSDVWLNTPQLGWEASGTSGMKAVSNGVLQCTVADGWAAEVDWQETGWVLDPNNTAESVYQTLEQHIIPLYFNRPDGLPTDWLKMMRRSIALSSHYSTGRMLQQYIEQLYASSLRDETPL